MNEIHACHAGTQLEDLKLQLRIAIDEALIAEQRVREVERQMNALRRPTAA